jgi:hypothetical protein
VLWPSNFQLTSMASMTPIVSEKAYVMARICSVLRGGVWLGMLLHHRRGRVAARMSADAAESPSAGWGCAVVQMVIWLHTHVFNSPVKHP